MRDVEGFKVVNVMKHCGMIKIIIKFVPSESNTILDIDNGEYALKFPVSEKFSKTCALKYKTLNKYLKKIKDCFEKISNGEIFKEDIGNVEFMTLHQISKYFGYINFVQIYFQCLIAILKNRKKNSGNKSRICCCKS